jgi:hypothetical protein
MAKNLITCRVCGKLFEPCKSRELNVGCKQECRQEYYRRIVESRTPKPPVIGVVGGAILEHALKSFEDTADGYEPEEPQEDSVETSEEKPTYRRRKNAAQETTEE